MILPAALAPLTALPNWLIWRSEAPRTPGAKPVKVPYRARAPRAHALSTNPETWATYQEAVAAAEATQASGIGFCLFQTWFSAFDIDDCRDRETGVIHQWALDLVARARSYTEVTTSGTGLRIIGFGRGDKIHKKFRGFADDVSIEIYRKAERYIVMTGDQLPDTSSDLADLDDLMDGLVAELGAARRRGANGSAAVDDEEEIDLDEIDDVITNGCGDRFGGDRSAALWKVVNELLARGMAPEKIEATILDRRNRISDHVYDQADPSYAAKRQVARARATIQLTATEARGSVPGKPHKTKRNVCIALTKVGVLLRRDTFSDKKLIYGLRDYGPEFTDGALIRIMFLLEERFKLRAGKTMLHDVITDVCNINRFNPVTDYLDALRWDGVSRVDAWLVTYAGATDSEYTRAVGRLALVAAVRRVRKPGCKFDEMVVLENPTQGVDKSTALAMLAVNDDWFSDDIPLQGTTQRAMEATRGRWIMEAAELSGMRQADIEHLKAFLSRRVDRARMAYDREVSDVPRQCVLFGTTNSQEYLRDTTGNRRFWPVLVTRFDIAALRRDRDQLWAEASALEAQGVSIRLEERLWPAASAAQEERLTVDPFRETLEHSIGHLEGKIATVSLWLILNVSGSAQTQSLSQRVNKAMRDLGWKRSANRAIRVEGRLVPGFTRGHSPHVLIQVFRGSDIPGGLLITQDASSGCSG